MEIADDDAMEIATEEVRADVVTVTHGDADATEEANRVEEEVVTAEVVVHHEEVAMEATSLAEGQVVTAGVVVEHPELAEIPVAHVVLGDNSRCRRPPLHLIAFNLRNSRPLRQI